MDQHGRHDAGVVKSRAYYVEIVGELKQAQCNRLGFPEEIRELLEPPNIRHCVLNAEPETVRLHRSPGNRQVLAQDRAVQG